ncbi:tripartite tricarboxylate transporter TctB family protein [Frigidibacter sp. MR17.24]|uniref:tripartite tricarboxylate transporter TctB family protein n=1 Tax=Frigidibacter sp. MR17.24 TaxID=3127345 RepID=UPI003012DBA8
MPPPIENPHHDGLSDATPGGYEDQRRPGEIVFTLVLTVFSAVMLWEAYGISGFSSLSGSGVVPMATAFAMLVSVLLVLARTVRLTRVANETVLRDITPPIVMAVVVLLVAYAILLQPLGFLPTSALFLIASIRLLCKRSWAWVVGVSLLTLFIIWFVFRIIFTVLMPAGIVPEAELIQFFRNLFHGA